MPCKNAGKFLDECLQSIIDQSFDDWELLVCNDNSTDNSLKILNDYKENNPRIKVSQNKGVGIIDALNTAYEQSSGEFITRMDADDKMPEDKLNMLIGLIENTDEPSVGTGKVKYFPEQEIKEGFLAYEQWINNLCDENSHWISIFKECTIPSPCWLMKRKYFEKIGGFKSSKYPEDYDLAWRMFLGGTKVIASTEILHFWRDHPERTSRNSKVYQNQTYFDLKVNFMLQIPKINKKTWVIWGAGKKGKALVKILFQKGKENIRWVCNNENKIGKSIYGVQLEPTESILEDNTKEIILICVSNTHEQKEVTALLVSKNYKQSKGYFILA